MKAILLVWALLLGGPVAPFGAGRPVMSERVAASVYVCMSKGSVAYHSNDRCAGLNRCTHPIKTMTAPEAQELGKRACLKCY